MSSSKSLIFLFHKLCMTINSTKVLYILVTFEAIFLNLTFNEILHSDIKHTVREWPARQYYLSSILINSIQNQVWLVILFQDLYNIFM